MIKQMCPVCNRPFEVESSPNVLIPRRICDTCLDTAYAKRWLENLPACGKTTAFELIRAKGYAAILDQLAPFKALLGKTMELLEAESQLALGDEQHIGMSDFRAKVSTLLNLYSRLLSHGWRDFGTTEGYAYHLELPAHPHEVGWQLVEINRCPHIEAFFDNETGSWHVQTHGDGLSDAIDKAEKAILEIHDA